MFSQRLTISEMLFCFMFMSCKGFVFSRNPKHRQTCFLSVPLFRKSCFFSYPCHANVLFSQGIPNVVKYVFTVFNYFGNLVSFHVHVMQMFCFFKVFQTLSNMFSQCSTISEILFCFCHANVLFFQGIPNIVQHVFTVFNYV